MSERTKHIYVVRWRRPEDGVSQEIGETEYLLEARRIRDQEITDPSIVFEIIERTDRVIE